MLCGHLFTSCEVMYSKQVGCCVVGQSKSRHQAGTQPMALLLTTRQHIESARLNRPDSHRSRPDAVFASLRMCVFACLHTSVPVCVCACLSAAISKLTRDTAEPVQLSTVVFCRRAEGLMTMVSPPHSRRRRDQSLLIRDIGEEESALV